MEQALERAVVRAIEYAVFGGEAGRRRFIARLGVSTAAAVLASVFPVEAARALAAEKPGPLEKRDLRVGFIPITCATPIIMAEPMGFYRRHGLDVQVIKASSWAMIRDLSINGETDATHMLSPMPLAITLGVGSQSVPYVMPAVENINGQAMTLHIKHRGVRSAEDMKGFKFGVPFDYSMHNLLLRWVLADAGLDPDRDVQIRAVPPPEMVANLRAGNLDGYLGPDPFNQRAVYEGVGFIWRLSKDIWPGHPCCGFAARRDFAQRMPNTFQALLLAIVDATRYAHEPANRRAIAAALAPRNYLNQPVEVLEQVLTGTFPDGLGQTRTVPDRIDFDPFPYHSMAIWILTQLKRWGYLKGDVSYRNVAREVFLTAACRDALRALGAPAPTADAIRHTFLIGKPRTFDPDRPEEYLASFSIRRN
ncbi:MAG TPA: CmpA/NrtA family ABC transporter substrate-binding protein [Calidithermus sp.]|nr:CmpA/NrtA family ABC transporter substrate-binding protein [Calidithermus sp.]